MAELKDFLVLVVVLVAIGELLFVVWVAAQATSPGGIRRLTRRTRHEKDHEKDKDPS